MSSLAILMVPSRLPRSVLAPLSPFIDQAIPLHFATFSVAFLNIYKPLPLTILSVAEKIGV